MVGAAAERPPLRVQRHESALGSWEMAHAEPAPALRGHVLHYCGYREDTAAPLARREVATTDITLIVSFGPELDVAFGRFQRMRSFVAGAGEGVAQTRHDGHQHGIEVGLSPLAARRLLGVPARELTGRVVALDAVLGRDAPALVERLWESGDWAGRFALLDAELGARLGRTVPVPRDIVHAWRLLRASHGRVGIAHLADELGWSRRHFGTRFREHVGLAPKPAARVMRFRRALTLLERGDGSRLGEIALASGYYDQAHFNRDFRALAGGPPGDFLRRQLPDGGGTAGG